MGSGSGYKPVGTSAPGSFPVVWWWGNQPKAQVWVFSTPVNPLTPSVPLVPLFRMSWKCGDSYSSPTVCSSNPAHVDTAYATNPSDVANYANVGYVLDGVEGYTYSKFAPKPYGTVRLYRKYNPARDDHAIFPDIPSITSDMAARGYTQSSGNAWIGDMFILTTAISPRFSSSSDMSARTLQRLRRMLVCAVLTALVTAGSVHSEIAFAQVTYSIPAFSGPYSLGFAEGAVPGCSEAGHFRPLDTSIDATSVTFTVSASRPPPCQSMRLFVPPLPAGIYSIETQLADGLPTDSNVRTNSKGTLAVEPSPPSIPIFALFEAKTATYFITAKTTERDSLLALGWVAADMGFRAWPADGPAPDAAKPVCRFFHPGKLTHFYANEQDCATLKSAAEFVYEGIAFRALRPYASRCNLGTQPVNRLFDSMRSNHRYTASSAAITTMLTFYLTMNESIGPSSALSKWTDEGIAFCSPTTG
ncbi:MAG: hypothetical protein ABL985_05835 [Casimicrobium sp.]